MKSFLFMFFGFVLYACATPSTSTLPNSFTTEKIMTVHQGMSSSEILNMFGNPKSVSQSVCGSDAGKEWTCTTWEYGEFPYDRATFTFSGNGEVKLLNDFKVDRK